jgi:TonB family protein
MRVFAVCAVLFALATPSFTQTRPRDAALREVVSALEKALDRESLVRISMIMTQPMLASAARQINPGEPDVNVEADIARRAEEVFRAYYRSAALSDSILRPWIEENFKQDEIEQLATFIQTPVGQKFVGTMGRLYSEIAMRSQRHAEPELMSALFGTPGEELVRSARTRRTAADMRTLATAVEAYATDHNRYPAAGDIQALKALISPIYIKRVPERDAWNRPFHYIVSGDGLKYRIVSGGADGVIDPQNQSITPVPREQGLIIGDAATADLVFQNGTFVAAPEGLIPPPPARRGEMGRSVTQRSLPPGYERVGGNVRAPVVLSRVEPRYPEEARAARISGIVITEMMIDAAGNVVDAVVLKPLPFGLDQAALDAVKQWRFAPATKNGVPVPVMFNVTINFKIDEPPPPNL